MKYPFPSSLSDVQRDFLEHSLGLLAADTRLLGVAAAGSLLTNTLDEFSDLDLVIVTESFAQEQVLLDRTRIAQTLGPLLSAFTGEHVGEPRLLVCLYDGAPPLHVDLKFITLADLGQRVEQHEVLWERDGRLSQALDSGQVHYPEPKIQWLEDRFWVWVHYIAGKAARGEVFEVLDSLAILRARVLGPLALMSAGARPAGVRKLERLAPQFVPLLQGTVASYHVTDCLRALRACVEAYRQLRNAHSQIELRAGAEAAAMRYLADIEVRCGATLV